MAIVMIVLSSAMQCSLPVRAFIIMIINSLSKFISLLPGYSIYMLKWVTTNCAMIQRILGNYVSCLCTQMHDLEIITYLGQYSVLTLPVHLCFNCLLHFFSLHTNNILIVNLNVSSFCFSSRCIRSFPWSPSLVSGAPSMSWCCLSGCEPLPICSIFTCLAATSTRPRSRIFAFTETSVSSSVGLYVQAFDLSTRLTHW